MIIEVVGYKKVDFVSKDTGEQIKGFNVYYTADKVENVKGCEAGKIFLSVEKAQKFDIIVGQSYEVQYNRWGKIDNMIKI